VFDPGKLFQPSLLLGPFISYEENEVWIQSQELNLALWHRLLPNIRPPCKKARDKPLALAISDEDKTFYATEALGANVMKLFTGLIN
jgi:hypothetical protein